MAALTDIQSGVWGLSLNGYGYLAQGLTLIRQRITIALTTTEGSDPLRPLFGSKIFLYVDKPILQAAANIRAEIYRCIEMWVNDVTVKNVTYTITEPTITFNIAYVLTNTEVTDNVEFELANGIFQTKTSTLTLQALFPANPNNYQYSLALSLNNTDASPAPPTNGFASIDALFAWVKTNWNFLATWLLQPEQLIAYLKDAAYKTGSLIIGLIEIFKIAAYLPALNPGETWNIDFTPVVGGETLHITGKVTKADVLATMQHDYADYGEWSLELVDGDFNDDFNDDFGVAKTSLVLHTTDYKNATITISKS